MKLAEYKRKRRFDRTPEPAGESADGGGRSFVVQKHDATRLHYDFRLELDGVLKSWAVPKGPSLDPGQKRLAVQVEDHPVEYGGFEGVIPADEYGGGTVMLWDRGHWSPVGDPQEGMRTGKLKFKLEGEKLRGAWMLVRIGKSRSSADGREWLLFKERDAEARTAGGADILEEAPLSVATGRALDSISAARDGALPVAAELYDARKQTFAGVRLTSPDKALYPDDGIAKLELAEYYRRVATWILPHLANRPLTLVRCPDGRPKKCFYQKHPPAGTPPALRQVALREDDVTEQYVVVDDVEGLISLAQIAALEIHAWGARADKPERPDRLVFDLDPDPQVAWPRVVASAREVRDFLAALGLESFVKTTGGKGLHLVVPIDRRHDWDEVKDFCKLVAESVVAAAPRHYTANMSKAARRGKVYIDYHRNARGATAVAAYSTRAHPGATVSTPLAWNELTPRVTSDKYTIRNLPRRLASLRGDPWQGLAEVRQGLSGPLKKLRALRGG